MSNETEQDVFEDALRALEEFGEQGSSWEMAYDDLSDRYAAALPDDIPVVSKDVSNIMRAYYFLWWKEFLDKAYDNELDKELSDDDDINYRVRSESAEVARALILGVWHVEETGEIVKLEEDK